MAPHRASGVRAVKMLAASRGSSRADPEDTRCSACSPPGGHRLPRLRRVPSLAENGAGQKCQPQEQWFQSQTSLERGRRHTTRHRWGPVLMPISISSLWRCTVKHVCCWEFIRIPPQQQCVGPRFSVSAPPPMYCLLSTTSTLLASTTANSAYYQNKSHNAFLSFKISQSVLILRPWSSCLFSFPRYRNKTSA